MEPQPGSDDGRQSTRGPMVLGVVVSVAATLLADCLRADTATVREPFDRRGLLERG